MGAASAAPLSSLNLVIPNRAESLVRNLLFMLENFLLEKRFALAYTCVYANPGS